MTEGAGTPVQDAAKPPLRLNQRPIATVCVVTPNYFRTLQIPIRRGRDFNDKDTKESERVAIVDEVLAKKFWPQYPAGLDPVGQQLLVGGSNPHPARIVGIVPAVHQNLEKNVWPETVYVAFEQSPQPFAMIAVRGEGESRRLTTVVRKAVQGMDRDLPVADVRTMHDLVDAELGQRKLVVDLLGSFAGVALLLAVIGIYGTISYSVTQRIQELGIRYALGAQRADILRLVIGQGVVLALIGIAAGMAGSYWLTKTLSGLLFGVSGTDPSTFAGIGVLFVTAAVIASYIPARRAARIDPMAALRV
jgi:predicted permease